MKVWRIQKYHPWLGHTRGGWRRRKFQNSPISMLNIGTVTNLAMEISKLKASNDNTRRGQGVGRDVIEK